MVRQFHILTDAADFSDGWMARNANRVTVIPDHVLIDGMDLSVEGTSDGRRKLPPADKFYEWQSFYMKQGKRFTTSAPSVVEIMDEMRPWLKRGQDVLYLTMCANLSNATANNGRLACLELTDELDLDEEGAPQALCLDSMCISMGLGYLVQLVLENCQTVTEAVSYVKQMRARIAHPFSVAEFKYLKAGGRIGRVAGTLAGMMKLRPFMDFEFREDGKRTLDAVGQNKRNLLIRNEGDLIQRFIQQTRQQISPEADRLIIVYGDCFEWAKNLAYELAVAFPHIVPELENRVGPTIGVHTGPNILSFFYIREDDPRRFIDTDLDWV